jgi:DNA-binding transcriptional LysR family regulator
MADAFEASGLEFPRSGIMCNSVQMHCALLATGPYLAMLPKSLLRFGHFDAMRVLPVALPVRPIPVGITALRNRTISPIVELFVECARDVAKPLAVRAAKRPSKSP